MTNCISKNCLDIGQIALALAKDYILSISTFTISELVPAGHVVVNLKPTSPFSSKAGYRRTQPGLRKEGSFVVNIFQKHLVLV